MSTNAHLMAFSAMLARDEDASKLNMRDLQLLALIVLETEPLSFPDIAKRLNMGRSNVSRVAERLVSRGFAARVPMPGDRRLALITPTPQGRALDARVLSHFHTTAPRTAA